MILQYIVTFVHNLGYIGATYLGASMVALVFLVGSAIHKLWSFIRGN